MRSQKRRRIWIVIGFLFTIVIVGTIGFFVGRHLGYPPFQPSIANVDCDVLILGAGFAGTYAAYQLANRSGERICLVEKLDRFGGRVLDVSGWPGGPAFGVGALRVTSSQLTMLALAHELGVELQREESDNELLRVRGQYFYRDVVNEGSESNDMCHTAFRNLTCEYPNQSNDTDKAMLSLLLQNYNTNKSVAFEYADFPNYISSLFGDEGLAFIRESVRYNSPFTSVSTHSMLDFFTNELKAMGLDPDRFYPVGGMSEYITRMLAYARKHHVRIYQGEPVLKIDSESSRSGELFVVRTPRYIFRAKSVLCAIDPANLRDVTGNIAEKLTAAPEFKVILPKTLAIVTAWWPERWWERSTLYRNLSRVVSHENCFNTMDIPNFPYGREQNVTRAVYDDGACVSTWQTLIDSGNKVMLAKTVVNSLGHVFQDIEIPLPKAIDGFVHTNAWHFQVADSHITNEQIFNWSHQPLEGKNFSLIGEGYNLDFAAWCDGALKSTMWALNQHYGFQYPCLDDPGSPAICNSKLHNRLPSTIKNVGRLAFG